MQYKGLIRRVVRYERKKIVLPILMLVVLISAVGLGSHLRSENVDREVLENSQHTMENATIILVEHKYFDQSIDISQRERAHRMSERMQRENRQIMNLPTIRAEVYLLGLVYKSGLYPLLPSAIPGQETSSILFSRNDGFFLTNTIPKTFAEISYFQYRTEELNKEINNSRENWTLERYRNKVDEIRSIDYPDKRITKYLRNLNSSDLEDSIPADTIGSIANMEGALNSVIQKEVKEVAFYHFIPSALSTFLLYYLVSGLFVEIFRIMRSKI
jgi:hypothetical protein